MRRRLPLILFLLVVVAAVVGLMARPTQKALTVAAAVGHRAPAFTLNNLYGHPITLAEQRGHTVLINFWATWCGPCVHELPAIDAARRASPGLRVLAVDRAEPADVVQSYLKARHVAIDSLLDPRLSVWNRYNVHLQPVTFWIDRTGIVRRIHYGAMDAAFIRREAKLLGA